MTFQAVSVFRESISYLLLFAWKQRVTREVKRTKNTVGPFEEKGKTVRASNGELVVFPKFPRWGCFTWDTPSSFPAFKPRGQALESPWGLGTIRVTGQDKSRHRPLR